MYRSTVRIVLVALLACALGSCDKPVPDTAVPSESGKAGAVQVAETDDLSKRLDILIREFSTDYYELHPETAINNGLHDYDGRLPDYSSDGIKRAISWYRDMQKRIDAINPTELTDQEWLYREQLAVIIDSNLFYLEQMKVTENNAWYGYDALDPDIYLSRKYAPPPVRMRAFIEHTVNMIAAVPAIMTNLRPMPPTHAHVMQNFMAGLAEFVSTTPQQVFAAVDDADLQEKMAVVGSTAALAYGELATWVERQPRDENFALGEARYAEMLWALERIDTPIADLKLLAEQDLERNLRALDKACAEFSPNTSTADCTAKMLANKFDEGPVRGAQAQLTMLRQLLLDKDVVSIPTDDPAVVAESPPHQRSNAAYMSMPGPYEKGMAAIYYISPPDPDWGEAEQLAYIPGKQDLMATSVHEVWPGHFLEGLHSNLSGNPVAALAGSYAFSEGWAHYAEEMMADEVLEYDAEMKIGQLMNALLRNVRFVSSLGLHTGGMSVAESEKLFREKAFYDPGNARQQAARGTFDPGYLFYTVGKLMIKKLRADWMHLHPDKSLREFHDTFLGFGPAPIPLLRKMMLGRDDDGSLFEIVQGVAG